MAQAIDCQLHRSLVEGEQGDHDQQPKQHVETLSPLSTSNINTTMLNLTRKEKSRYYYMDAIRRKACRYHVLSKGQKVMNKTYCRKTQYTGC